MINLLKESFSLKHIGYLLVNLFCLVIIFFVLDKETGGSFPMRIFAYAFCIAIGGLFGVWWSRKREGSKESWFRNGSGILLVFFTLLSWGNNKGGYTEMDCSGNTTSYNEGYTHGRIVSYAYDAKSTSCRDWIEGMAGEGITIRESDCLCSGYYDGRDGRMNKHK